MVTTAAPRIGLTGSKRRRCGKAARAQLASLAAAGRVTCQPLGDDRYGRALATCGGPIADDFGRELVRAGLAMADGAYEKEQDSARDAKRGIWAGNFTTPAEWREQHPREDRS